MYSSGGSLSTMDRFAEGDEDEGGLLSRPWARCVMHCLSTSSFGGDEVEDTGGILSRSWARRVIFTGSDSE